MQSITFQRLREIVFSKNFCSETKTRKPFIIIIDSEGNKAKWEASICELGKCEEDCNGVDVYFYGAKPDAFDFEVLEINEAIKESKFSNEEGVHSIPAVISCVQKFSSVSTLKRAIKNNVKVRYVKKILGIEE